MSPVCCANGVTTMIALSPSILEKIQLRFARLPIFCSQENDTNQLRPSCITELSQALSSERYRPIT